VSALPAPARVLAAALRALAGAMSLWLLLHVASANDPPVTVGALARAFAVFVAVPELCARFLLRAFEGSAHVARGSLVVVRSGRRVEVPCASIASLRVWGLPLPTPGATLELASGASLPARIALADPGRLLSLLDEAGVAAAGAALPQPAVRYAAARAAWPVRWYERPVCKVGLFALLPAAVGFYAHQHIAFGGLFGEYYLMGFGAWLRTAAEYLLTALLYLALWAVLFRVVSEGALLAWAQLAPERAGGARRIAERAATALFYVSVPAFLALRFLA
jgi:apolipoprotein N-acyltransferase